MINLDEDPIEQNDQPPPSASGMHRLQKQQIQISNDNQTRQPSEDGMTSQLSKTQSFQNQPVTGCTKYCKLAYYKEYFKIGQTQVISRIKSSITLPPTQDFIERTQNKPDFYGPFWICTTIIFLAGFIGNFANYFLSKFSYAEVWNSYFFQLEYIRYGVSFIYPYGFALPAALFFLFKFLDKDLKLKLPQIICVYGYALTPYIPAIILCIIPLGFLQWILILSAGAISAYFLLKSLKNHLNAPSTTTLAIIIFSSQLLFSIILKKLFLQLLE